MKTIGTRVFPTLQRLLLAISVVIVPGALSAGAQDASCSECTCAGDSNGDGKVSVAEVVTVVDNALHGCPELRWYLDCPPRVPGKQVCPPTLSFCTSEEVGATCDEPGTTCCRALSLCAGGECNASLVCTDKDPRNGPAAQCRLVSRRGFKRDIEYLSSNDLEQLRGELLGMNLTRFRYKDEPASIAPHLGFIIEDVEPSPSVDSQSDAVDLYGYVSMAVATIQVQDREIQALRRELGALRLSLSSPTGTGTH